MLLDSGCFQTSRQTSSGLNSEVASAELRTHGGLIVAENLASSHDPSAD